MFTVCGIKDLNYFVRNPALISVFVASEFDTPTVKWVFDCWGALDKVTGRNWHMLVPTEVPIHDDKTLVKADNFNFELAQELLDLYGMKRSDAAALVFDNFNDEERQLFIRLETMSQRELRQFFIKSGEIAERNPPAGYSEYDLRKWRDEVMSTIFHRQQLRSIARLVTPGSIVRLAFSAGRAGL
jgi:hypothetical protein